MNDKMKFGDLFEKIAQETGSSPEVIRELKKQMGIELRESLEKDGSTHLNGLGTFYLKWSEEREGINPQTGEKIEIPAHNHITFRPDASVRRLINKENEHLKTFILDDDGNKEPDVPVVLEEPKTKVPSWIWILVAILALGLVFSLLSSPKEVVVAEEIIVVEEVVVTNEVLVVEKVVVTNEVLVVEEIVVAEGIIEATPVAPVPAETPVAKDDMDTVEEASDAPEQPPIDTGAAAGAYIDPDIAEAEAGMAEAIADEKVAIAEEAIEKAEKSGSQHADKKATEAVVEAEKAIVEEIKADKKAIDAKL